MKDYESELESAIAAARKAGTLICEHFEKKNHVIRKSKHELVTKVDVESQTVIRDYLKSRFPSYGLITEETRNQEEFRDMTWVVDPLDGTHNFIAGIDNFGVSIALMSPHAFHLGVICIPMKNLLIHSVRGGGAYCNDARIRVGGNPQLEKSMVAYDNQFYSTPDVLENFKKLTASAFTTRIFGVATYDIALIATGKIDARIWNSTKLVDVAAGNVIIHEAGGKLTDFRNQPLTMNVKDVIASNGLVHDELVRLLTTNVDLKEEIMV